MVIHRDATIVSNMIAGIIKCSTFSYRNHTATLSEITVNSHITAQNVEVHLFRAVTFQSNISINSNVNIVWTDSRIIPCTANLYFTRLGHLVIIACAISQINPIEVLVFVILGVILLHRSQICHFVSTCRY